MSLFYNTHHSKCYKAAAAAERLVFKNYVGRDRSVSRVPSSLLRQFTNCTNSVAS